MTLLSKLTRLVLPPLTDLQTLLVAALIFTIAVFVFFEELLKPVDKQKPPSGKKWKLPPGPRGYPIVGDLFFYLKGEKAVSENPVVSE